MGPRSSSNGLALVAILVIAAGVLALVKLFSGGAAQSARGGDVPVPIGIATVAPATFIDRLDAIGTVRSNESVTITAKVTETVRRVAFTDGQIVAAGDILVELTDAAEAAALGGALSAHAEAAKNFERISVLASHGMASAAQLDAARTARDNAKSRVDTVASQLADRLIRAPFAGVLGLRNISPGTLVRPGDVITTLDDISAVKLDFTVPETYLASLATGMQIEAEARAFPGRAFTGALTAIDTRIDPITRSVTARAIMPNADLALRPGMLLNVTIIRSTKTALAIAERAVVASKDQLFVFRVEGGKAQRVEIKTGARQDGLVEVAAGLAAGDTIVVDGVHRLRPGQRVQVVELDGVPAPQPASRPQS
jgi:membrane fusion protein (multidrug efflux system)